MANRRKVLFADDHPIVANGMAELMRPHYDIADVVTVLEEIAPAVRRSRPDVVFLDLSFGEQCGLTAIPAILTAHPSVHIIVLTSYAESALAEAAREAGAKGYLLKSSDVSQLHCAIVDVLAGGECFTSRAELEKGHWQLPHLRTQLTPLVVALLEELGTGKTHEQAGETFEISGKGVDYHLDKLRHSLGFKNTKQLLRWFSRVDGHVN